jgi:hypothetical protein
MPTRKHFLVIIGSALLLSFLVRFIQTLFFEMDYNYDLESFLYLGSRLRFGELLFMKDFETKFPMLQYLFYVPACLGGIGAWSILVFTVVSVSCTAGSFLYAEGFLKSGRIMSVGKGWMTFFLTGTYLAILYVFPDGMQAHVSSLSGSLVYLAFAILASERIHSRTRVLHLSVGLLVSFAGLLRPNYLYILPVVTLWMALRCRGFDREWFRSQMLPFSIGVVSPVVISFLPYLFVKDGFRNLYDGHLAIGAWSNGADFMRLLSDQLDFKPFRYPFYWLLYAVCLLLCISLLRAGKSVLWPHRHMFSLNAMSVVFMNLSFLRNHFYAHYVLQFVSFFLPMIWLSMILLIRRMEGGVFERYLAPVLLVPVLSITLLIPATRTIPVVSEMVSGRSGFNLDINDRGIDHHMLRFLDSSKSEGLSFLVLHGQVYHRLLDEPRIGDGHWFMLLTTLNGKKTGPVGEIRLYSARVHSEPCLALLESGKDLIVLSKDSESPDAMRRRFSKMALRCLARGDSPYRVLSGSGLEAYEIYKLKR